MKRIFLLNRFSLKDKTNDIAAYIIKAAAGTDYKIEINSLNRSTEDIIEEYKDSNSIIICVGGDGTINRTLNGIVGTNNVLGYIPYGTGNDFYKSNKELLESGISDVDLVRINDKYFINIACFGIDADVANADDLVHSGGYVYSLLHTFAKYKARHLKVSIDDEVYEKDFTTVAVCNGRYYGGKFKIGTNALLDDGLVDVYMADNMSKLKMGALILGMNKAKHEKNKAMKIVKCKKLYIESPTELTCNIDGDKLTSKSFDIEVIPHGIKVYYDQGLIDNVKQQDVQSRRKKKA
jgi:YegS/Rv2252/BmrU family lipid kinase